MAFKTLTAAWLFTILMLSNKMRFIIYMLLISNELIQNVTKKFVRQWLKLDQNNFQKNKR